MASKEKIKIPTIVSTSELERRWKAVRQAMKEEGLDFLIMHNVTNYLGGYVKWFTDMSARNNYPFTVIFPRDDEMTTVRHGPQLSGEPGPPSPTSRGIKKEITVPALPSLCYSSTFEAEKVVQELAKHGNCRIGFVGMGHISAASYNYITGHLKAAKFTDATDLVDKIKAIKSDEEIRYIRDICALQDATFKNTLTCIQPGKKDFELYADIMHQCLNTGSEQANIILRTDNKVIKEGDRVSVTIESNGPSGFYAEMGRTICVGKVPPQLQEHFELGQKAKNIIVGLLKPGTAPLTIWNANNDFLRSIGSQEETRLCGHGMGYDMVERPCLSPGETMKIQARMNFAVHASVVFAKGRAAGSLENYLVSETGEAERLHKTPQKIFAV